ncbi:MAG: LytTR family DNA-binding domain-containing protein [Bryobacteraceae bacterium]|nr:LytTR family DNA-binding domain-containing protein [Bryobacteraceae bacterium]
MKAVLVDDEELARFELRRLLRAHPEIEIVGEAKDGEEALRLTEEAVPDILFLDIQMPGMTGFDLLERINGDLPAIIFTTAFDQHAIKAFEVNALDYLLKPISPQRLSVALGRLSPRRPTNRLSQVFVRDGDRCWIVRLPDIFLLESEGNYTRVCFGAERPLIRRSLNSLEQQLDRQMFFRANRRQILNLNWIETTHLAIGGGLLVRLKDTTEVELSRRQADELKARLSL